MTGHAADLEAWLEQRGLMLTVNISPLAPVAVANGDLLIQRPGGQVQLVKRER